MFLLCFLLPVSDFAFFVFRLHGFDVLKREERLFKHLIPGLKQTAVSLEFPKLTGLSLKLELRLFTNLLWFSFLGLLLILSLYFLGLELIAERYGHLCGEWSRPQQQ